MCLKTPSVYEPLLVTLSKYHDKLMARSYCISKPSENIDLLLSSPKTEMREMDSIVECAGELKCDNLVIVIYGDKATIKIGV